MIMGHIKDAYYPQLLSEPIHLKVPVKSYAIFGNVIMMLTHRCLFRREILSELVRYLWNRGAVFRPGVVIQYKHTTANLFTD